MSISVRTGSCYGVARGTGARFPAAVVFSRGRPRRPGATRTFHRRHTSSESDDGPRGVSPMTKKQRDAYPNRVLLCLEHHKIVDDDPYHWTVDRLLQVKAEHEAWVESVTSDEDGSALAAALIYADVIQHVEAEINFKSWNAWTTGLLAPTPSIHPEMLERIERLREWLFRRPWPATLPELEVAFENLRRVLDDVAMVCQLGLEEKLGRLMLVPEYKKRWVENYDELADQFEWTVDVSPRLDNGAYASCQPRLRSDPKADRSPLPSRRGRANGRANGRRSALRPYSADLLGYRRKEPLPGPGEVSRRPLDPGHRVRRRPERARLASDNTFPRRRVMPMVETYVPRLERSRAPRWCRSRVDRSRARSTSGSRRPRHVTDNLEVQSATITRGRK